MAAKPERNKIPVTPDAAYAAYDTFLPLLFVLLLFSIVLPDIPKITAINKNTIIPIKNGFILLFT